MKSPHLSRLGLRLNSLWGCGGRPSLRPELVEHFRLDIASTDDSYIHLCVRELVSVEDESGGGDGAAGLGDCLGIGREIFHGLADFVFGDGNDVVDEGADVL